MSSSAWGHPFAQSLFALLVQERPSPLSASQNLAIKRCPAKLVSEHICSAVESIEPYLYTIAVGRGRPVSLTAPPLLYFRGMISGALAEPIIGASSTDNQSGFQTACSQKEMTSPPPLALYLNFVIWLKLLLQDCSAFARQMMLAVLLATYTLRTCNRQM